MPVRCLPLTRRLHPAADARALAATRALLAEVRPAILHTHMAKAGTIGRLAAATVRPRPRTVHTFHGHVLDGYSRPGVELAFHQAERALARHTDVLVAVSPQVRDVPPGPGDRHPGPLAGGAPRPQLLVHDWEAGALAGPACEDLYRDVILPVKLAIDAWYLENASLWIDVLVVAALLGCLRGGRRRHPLSSESGDRYPRRAPSLPSNMLSLDPPAARCSRMPRLRHVAGAGRILVLTNDGK